MCEHKVLLAGDPSEAFFLLSGINVEDSEALEGARDTGRRDSDFESKSLSLHYFCQW